jgi:hypothetical protein
MVKLPFDAEGYQLDAVSGAVAFALHAVDVSSSIRLTQDGGRSWQTIRAVRSGA